MVTKKTRLLSAIAAVLMLVSMFAGFVIPASAEDATTENVALTPPASAKAYKERTTEDTAVTDWLITDEEDWLYAVLDSNAQNSGKNGGTRDTFEGKTLWFTNDLDFSKVASSKMDTIVEAVMGARASSSETPRAFNGTIQGQGHAIYNFNVDLTYSSASYTGVALIGRADSAAVIRDLTLASGSIKFTNNSKSPDADNTKGTETYVGAFLAQGNGVTFVNCWNNADVYVEGVNSKWDSNKAKEIELYLSASIFGRKYSGTMINCINTGKIYNNDKNIAGTKDAGGRATIFAEWHNGAATDIVHIVNAYSAGGHKPGPAYKTGLVCVTKDATKLVQGDYFKNLYGVGIERTDGHSADSAINNDDETRLLEEGVETSGELAWLMNTNYDDTYDAMYGRKYYTVKNNQTVWGTKEEQPVKVNVVYNEETVTVYPTPGSTVDLTQLGIETVGNVSYSATHGSIADGVLTVVAPESGDRIDTVKIVSDTVDFAALEEALAAFDGKNTDYYIDANGVVLTAEYNEILANMKTYTQAQVLESAKRLGEFAFNSKEELSITEFETYASEAVYYTVASADELEYLSTIKTQLDNTKTIYFTADIDLTTWVDENGYDGDVNDLTGLNASLIGKKADGEKAKIIGLAIKTHDDYSYSGWIGAGSTADTYYTGKAIKNLEFINGTLNATHAKSYYAFLIGRCYNKEITLENLTFDNCIITAVPNEKEGGQGIGLITGTNSDVVKKATFEKITIKNCTIGRDGSTYLYDAEKGYTNQIKHCNSGFLAAKFYETSELILNNVYLEGNTITGTEAGGGRGVLLGEAMNKITMNNIAVLNTAIDESGVNAILGIFKYDSADKILVDLTANNIIVAGNGVNAPLISSTVGSPKLTVTNVYTDLATFDGGLEATEDSSVVVMLEAADAITSGAAAYALNAVETVTQKWAMDGTTPIFVKDDEKAPVEVTFTMNIEGEASKDYKKYTDQYGKLIVDEAFQALADWEIADWDAVYEANAEVTGIHTHAYESVIDPESTCTETGVKTFTCACEKTYTEVVEKKDHTPGEVVVENEVAATCGAAGSYEEVVYCTVCNAELSRETKTIEATGEHTEGEAKQENVVGATCGVAGSYDEVVYCTVCNAELSRETKTIEATGEHTEGDVVVENEVKADCENGGSYDEVVYCTVCDAELSRETKNTDALGHAWDEGKITTEPTYEATGVKTYTCKNDPAHTKTETVPMLTGAEASVNGVKYATLQEALNVGGEVTLEKDIKSATYFTVSNTVVLNLNNKTVEADGTVFYVNGGNLTIKGEGTVIGDADYNSGNALFVANNGYAKIEGGTYITNTDKVTTDPHTNDSIYTISGGKVDIYGGTFEAREGVWVLNCYDENEGTIKVYGGTFVGFNPGAEKDAFGKEVDFLADGYHSIGVEGTYTVSAHVEEIIPAVAPTCTADGSTAGVKCSVCDKVLTAPEVAPALGHTDGEVIVENEVAADCTNNGSYDNVVYCTVCNAEVSRNTVTVDALGHAEKIIPAVDATCTKTGLTEGEKCSVCGDILVAQEEIPALGHKKAIDQNNKIICGVCGDALETEAGIIYVNGAGYLVDENGDLVDGVFAEWGNYGELFIKDGQPSGTGVFEWKEHGYVYITSKHKLAGKDAPTLFYLNNLTDEERENLGIAGDKFYGYYLVEDGKLVDKTFADWNETFTDLYIVNGQPSGAGVFDIEDYGLVYVTAGHKIAGQGEVPALHHLGNLSDEDKAKLGITRNDYANYYLFKDGKIFSNDFADWNETYTDLFIVNGQPSGAGVFEWVGHGKVYITAGHKLAGADAPEMYYLTNAQEEQMFEGKDYTDKYYNYYMIQGGKILAEGVADWGTLPYKDRYIVNGQPANGEYRISEAIAGLLNVDAGTYIFSGGKIKSVVR